MNDELESILVCETKNGNKAAPELLYKVKRSKKLSGELHEIFESPTNQFLDFKAYFKSVKGELFQEELKAINGNFSAKGDFYDYQSLRGVLLRKLNGEFDDGYFYAWLNAMSNIFNNEKYEYIHHNQFESMSCINDCSKARVLEIMARLKDYNYKLNHKDFMLRHKKDKLKVIYLKHSHFNKTCNQLFIRHILSITKAKGSILALLTMLSLSMMTI